MGTQICSWLWDQQRRETELQPHGARGVTPWQWGKAGPALQSHRARESFKHLNNQGG